MRVSELMTEKVLTIGPEAPIKDVAKVLVANGISGLPVCDIEGRVLGVAPRATSSTRSTTRQRATSADRSAGSSTVPRTTRGSRRPRR